MEAYETPVMEVVEIEEDLITASGKCDGVIGTGKGKDSTRRGESL